MLRRRKKSFIEINLAPKKKRKFFPGIFSIEQIEKKDLLLYSVSLVSFFSIFAVQQISNKILEEYDKRILALNREINLKNRELQNLKRAYNEADKKFKDFYIPNLKEKVFIIWYNDWWKRKVVAEIRKFQKIAEGLIPYMGVWVYPNPFKSGSGAILKGQVPQNVKEYVDVKGNPFLNVESLPYVKLPGLHLLIEKPSVDKKFLSSISQIKDETIKANLYLEYALLKYPINDFKISSGVLLLFPITGVFTEERDLKELENYCNVLLIRKRYERNLFMNNRWVGPKLLDGVCIKYVF